MWIVEVVAFDDGKVVKTIECRGGERDANKVDRGVNINNNHEKYYTRIVERKTARAAIAADQEQTK